VKNMTNDYSKNEPPVEIIESPSIKGDAALAASWKCDKYIGQSCALGGGVGETALGATQDEALKKVNELWANSILNNGVNLVCSTKCYPIA
jgi:hypothetical protein